eukprot:CAMPEP_0184486444 /NCGR_PEP_ID=MMETSP0113_2-20130426/7939_1 /TAXON_ID=91329 /ORGANISM="Norrisiella sphaerica, Strain BC52" /LENGTH=725 /DNA_ID=CAMNT_0026868335 /DNA_START=449 /DNA_END=2626 /DNA_ORIENTATION=-
MIQASAGERDNLQARLKERHLEMIQLLEALDRQKAQTRALKIQRRQQETKFAQALEKIEILRGENLHLRQSSEQEARASKKHTDLLKQQLSDRTHEIKLLEGTLSDARKDATDQRQVFESRIAAQGKRRLELEQLLQDRIDELEKVKSTAKDTEYKLNDRIAKLQAEAANLSGEIRSLNGVCERNTELEKSLEETRLHLTNKGEELVKATEAKAFLTGELKLERSRSESTLEEVKKITANLSSAKHALSTGLAEAEKKMQELKATADKKLEDALKEAEAKRKSDVEIAAETIKRVEAEKVSLESKLSSLQEVRTRNEELKQSIEAMNLERKELVEKFQSTGLELREEIKTLTAQKAEIEGEYRVRMGVLEKLEKESIETQIRLDKLRERLAAVQTENIDLRSRNTELDKRRELAMQELAVRVDRSEKERTHSHDEYTRVFGDLKHHQCLATELAKRLETEKAAAYSDLEKHRKELEDNIKQKLAQRESKMKAEHNDYRELEKERDHFKLSLERMSIQFSQIRRKMKSHNDATTWWLRWQVSTLRRKYLRMSWKQIIYRLQRRASLLSDLDRYEGEYLENESSKQSKDHAAPEADNSQDQIQQASVKPSALVRDAANMYHSFLSDSMKKVGDLLYELESHASRQKLVFGFQNLENAVESYYGHLLAGVGEKLSGLQLSSQCPRELETFEAETAELSKHVTELIHASANRLGSSRAKLLGTLPFAKS